MLNETQRAPPRYKISDFFSSLLELDFSDYATSQALECNPGYCFSADSDF